MNAWGVVRGWGSILAGHAPFLSLEITRECPLSCPGCYAYGDDHLGGTVTLRELRDAKGSELVEGVLRLLRKHKPLHVSLVGGEPLVRYRELSELLPQISAMGVWTQLVTSAVRPIPIEWAAIPRLILVVSIDGLQPEHDERRKPATYERIIKSIAGQRVTIHCTITSQMMNRAGYLEEFLQFWSPRPEIRKFWFSIFTPQRGDRPVECLSPEQRKYTIAELLRLRLLYPKIDMAKGLVEEFAHPPQTPDECIFSRTTTTISADLKTRVTPCQFGGDPDCSQCGCIASMGLAAVANHKLAGVLPVRVIFNASGAIGNVVAKLRAKPEDALALPPGNPPRTMKPAPAPVQIHAAPEVQADSLQQ